MQAPVLNSSLNFHPTLFTAPEADMTTAILVHDIYKSFGKTRGARRIGLPWQKKQEAKSANGNDKNGARKKIIAVDHVSFEVYEGEIFGVLGPNGGGKSTLIRLMSTLLLPDGGEITVFGHDVVSEPMAVQRLINRVSVEASFFKKLSPMENLLYGARLYGLNGPDTGREVEAILKRLGLEDRSIYSPMEQMSRGMQQKVAIARALLSHPRRALAG